MDTIEKLKQERFIRNLDKKRTAPLLKVAFPDIDHIEVVGYIHFTTSVGSTTSELINKSISPEENCYLNIDCINNDCTSDGFDLTSSMEESIRRKNCVKVLKRCDGKEDWKYLNASGCSCATTLECTIIPHFKC